MTRRFTGLVLFFSSAVTVLTAQPKKADLSRLYVVGDSLSAGFQNFSLLGSQQVHSYAYLIAGQIAGHGENKMILPLVNDPGVPNVLQLKSLNPPVIQPSGDPPIQNPAAARVDLSAIPTNLAVPGVTIGEVLTKRPGSTINSAIDFMTQVVLGFPEGTPQSQVERVTSLDKPATTIIFWAGSNDLLLAELAGDFRLLTSPASFWSSLDSAVGALSKTGASLVIANLPDPTVVPYFISAETIAAQAGVPVEDVRTALGLDPGDRIRPVAQRMVSDILARQMPGPLPQYCEDPDHPGAPVIPGLPFTKVPCVFRNAEAEIVRAYAAAFNNLILGEATLRHATLVDTFSLTNDLVKNGYHVSGRHLSLDFLGGLITLDGLHPTNTLHAIIANEFIKTMNKELKAGIPPVSVEQIAKADPLLPPKMK